MFASLLWFDAQSSTEIELIIFNPVIGDPRKVWIQLEPLPLLPVQPNHS